MIDPPTDRLAHDCAAPNPLTISPAGMMTSSLEAGIPEGVQLPAEFQVAGLTAEKVLVPAWAVDTHISVDKQLPNVIIDLSFIIGSLVRLDADG